jgi:hypothetical protein
MRPSQLPKRGIADRGFGARRLLAAMLERAVKDALGPTEDGGGACSQAERDRALVWFAADESGPGTFRWLCSLLDLDAASVRGAIRQGGPQRLAVLDDGAARIAERLHPGTEEQFADRR